MDDDFQPRLGRMRAVGSKRGRKYLHAVLASAMRAGLKRRGRHAFDGSRVARGTALARLLSSRGPHAGLRARRAVVKTRLVRLGGRGFAAARAHLRYIQRDGVSREGEPGRLYSDGEDAADGRAFIERCDGDRHQFRFIVSAEDGAEYDDLKPLIRRFMQRMEQDLGTSLDWVAADHVDTLHPHTHIMLRGRDDRGENLVIAREYISRGMRERLGELVMLDLGPRTDLEIERRLRLDVEAERLTPLDRRLLRDIDVGGSVAATGRDAFDHSVRMGRLRKLEALGLAECEGGARWRLSPDMETTLRALGERGDIIRTMQRALAAAGAERAPADQQIYDPARGEALTGRIVGRGLADEVKDRHYLIIDGADGRTHFVDVGAAEAVEPLASGTIVRIEPRAAGVREVDRTVAAVAAANVGRYSVELHLDHDSTATRAFAEAHVRRLEAMRRSLRLERSKDGVWLIPENHVRRVEKLESGTRRLRPVSVEVLSPLPLDRLRRCEGATWLDRELASEDPLPLRDSGFGREVRSALAVRRTWLLQEELAVEEDGRIRIRSNTQALLQRRELLRSAAELSRETGKDFVEPAEGLRVAGVVRRRIDLASGRFALVENSREFSLVPWRPVHERAFGKEVSGIFREGGTSWTIGRDRGLEI